MERSAEFYRGAKWFRDTYAICSCKCGDDGAAVIVDLLAEAEAREASAPTAADLAVADELDMLAAHIQQYIGPDDARDDIRRICRNRAEDLRRGVKRGPTAAEVIAAAERALLQVGQWDAFTQREKGLMKYALDAISKWKEAQ